MTDSIITDKIRDAFFKMRLFLYQSMQEKLLMGVDKQFFSENIVIVDYK